jgi:iron complex outermembrane receptor protein
LVTRLVLLPVLACVTTAVAGPVAAADVAAVQAARPNGSPGAAPAVAPGHDDSCRAEAPHRRDPACPPPRLDTVVVTARHRAETLQQAPLSITALDAAELESRGAGNLTALAGAVPNVTLYPARQYNNAITASIRGVGQSETVWGVEPGVGVYVDDVFLARPQAALLDVLDVERIEVLRGPQGTLYGRNTLGGAIRYITRAPTVDVSGSVGLTLGQYGQRDAKAVLNLPLSGRLLTRVAVAQFGRAGYGRNLFTGAHVSARDAFVARVSADWALHDALSLRLAYDAYLDDSGPPGAQRLVANPRDATLTPPDPGRYDVRSGAPAIDEAQSRGASATLDWRPGGAWRFKSITAARRSRNFAYADFDLLPAPISDLQRKLYEEQRSQEFQLQGEGERADASLGLYLFDGEAGGRVRNIRARAWSKSAGWVRTRSAAVYGDATWRFAPHWSLEAGLRYTVERKSARVLNRGYTDASYTVPNGLVSADFTDAATFRALSPRLNLAWRPGPNAMLYAQVSRGFRAGGYNIRANTRAVPESGRPFRDESVLATELGAKFGWRDGRVTADLAVFQGKHRDIQLSVSTSYDSDGDGVKDAFFGDFRNAGAGTSRGAEVELALQAPRTWRVLGHAGYLDTRFDRYLSGGVDIAASQRFTNAPRWTAGASVIADVALARGDGLTARVDGAYRSKAWPSGDLTESGGLSARLAQGGHALWNASLAWRSPAARWQLTLAAQNLGGKDYHVTGWDLPILGIASVFNGPPRTLSANATYRFR